MKNTTLNRIGFQLIALLFSVRRHVVDPSCGRRSPFKFIKTCLARLACEKNCRRSGETGPVIARRGLVDHLRRRLVEYRRGRTDRPRRDPATMVLVIPARPSAMNPGLIITLSILMG